MSGIDAAADAFSADMNGGTPANRDMSSKPATMAMEDLFTPRSKETDEVAGGDDLPDENSEAPRRQSKAKTPKDEADDDADEDEQEDEKDDAEQLEYDPDALVTVTVDGKEKEVSLKEALEGYIRTDTFHQRLSEINEQKTVIRTEATKLLDDRREAITLLSTLQEDLEKLMPTEPDWDKLFAEDPAKARGLQKQFTDFKDKLEGIRNERKIQQQKLQEDSAKNTKAFAETERGKFEGAKENQHWQSDPKKKEKDLASMVRTAKSVGFTDDEIRGTLDSRMLTILLRASKYDRMTARKPTLNPRGVKPTKPGAGKSVRQITARKGNSRAQQQLARTGRVDDAAEVFKQFL